MKPTTLLDLNWVGRPRSIACALLRSADSVALIDPGPASCVPALRKELAAHGLEIADLTAILLTHIHLDHAGATGTLLRENPRIPVYVHENGARHLLAPDKLLESASRLFGAQMQRLFGEFLAVPEANVRVLRGDEIVEVCGRRLAVRYTPGHAHHHVTYFDAEEGLAFVGDTAGICVNGHPYMLPATPPPDISLELWDASLEAIADLHPQRLFLTHFGFSDSPAVHLAHYRQRLHDWSDRTARILASNVDEAERVKRFVEEAEEEATKYLSVEEFSHYAFTGSLHLSFLGLVRYQRKRAGGASQSASR